MTRALELDGRTPAVRVLAGEAYAVLGQSVEARRQWNRALFGLPDSARDARVRVLRLLARLEDRQGEPASALRLWRSVLEIEPSHPEAQRRIAELSVPTADL